MGSDGERRARVMLSFLAQPGDPVLGAALRSSTAAEILAAISGADADGHAVLAAQAPGPALAADGGRGSGFRPRSRGWRPGRTAGFG